MSRLADIQIGRRALLALPFASIVPPAASDRGDAMRFFDPVAISPDDIAWFRSCRSQWIDSEAGSPAIFPDGVTPDDAPDWFEANFETYVRRLEPILCAFFLNARFVPGRYTFAKPVDGTSGVDVDADDIKLLQVTNWRTFAIDPKRPYGDYTHFVIDMARALGLVVARDEKGHDTLSPADETRMEALHRRMRYVVQAYLEHARLEPGRWFIPQDGWDLYVVPRCRPISAEAISSYEAAMARIAARVGRDSDGDLVVPRFHAQALLFARD